MRFDFGDVLAGAVIEHDFTLKNEGAGPLTIQKVNMTTPLLVTKMPRQVAPGAEEKIHFKLDTKDLAGKFAGTIVVFLDDAASPEASLAFSGNITPAVEVSPMAAFYVSGRRGIGGRGSVEIVNHEPEPLRIEKIEHQKERFTTGLETLQQGQRYHLNLNLKQDGPTGRSVETIVVRTSSKKSPLLKITANTYLFEKVHTFPESVAFGTLRSSEAGEADSTLMIYQEEGRDFQVKLSSDVPGMKLSWERGPKGDRYQAKIALVPGKIALGPIRGSIFVDTNDAKFPRLIVPVSGELIGR